MPSAAAALIRHVFELTYTHDSFESVLPLYHPELVYHPRADEPDPSPHHGRDAYERLIRGFLDAFSEITFEIREVVDAGDVAVASTLLRGRGSASGAEVTDAYVFVYDVRDALVVEGWEYRTLEQALAAHDIQPSAASAGEPPPAHG
jgi:ketosteroid isomerase-like protein